MWATVALIVTTVIIVFLRANSRPAGFPPGPFALPFFGNILSIIFYTPQVALKKFVEDYGGILSFKMFNQWRVLVSDPALMRPSMADSATSGRLETGFFDQRNFIIQGKKSPPLGILGTCGDVWKEQRRFTLRTLKDLGFGRNTLEPIMQEELEELLQLFRQRQGQKTDVDLLFNRSIINIIWAIIIGKRYTYEDRKFRELVEKVNKMMLAFDPFHPVFRFRWVKKLFPNLSILRTNERCMRDLIAFIEREIDVYKQQTGGQVDMGCYVGTYLHHLDQLKPGEEDDTTLSMDHLKANILELFLAGSDTISSTLRWAVYLLATNQNAQRAMQEELDRVVGRDNTPTLAHMDRLPYTLATIYEVQRVGDILPRAVWHTAMDDVFIGGYRIPKGTPISFNLSHGLSHPKYWKNPEKFLPEHFLTDDGKLFKPDHFMPYGSGKRVCLGESLARLEVFVFIAVLMHRFSWRLSDEPVVWVASTFINRPPNFSVYAVSRE